MRCTPCGDGREEVDLLAFLGTLATVLLWVVLVVLGLFALLGLLLMFLPWEVRFKGESDLAAAEGQDTLAGRAEGQLRLRWGLLTLAAEAAWHDGALASANVRLLGRPVTGGGRRVAQRSQQKKTGRRPGRRGSGRRRRPPRPDPALLWAIFQELAHVPGRFWRSLGARFTGELTYGFSDPSLTGLCEAVRWGAGIGRSLRLTPDFQRPCLVGWAELTGRLYGYRLLTIAWRMLRRREIWNHLVGHIKFRPLRQILLQGGS